VDGSNFLRVKDFFHPRSYIREGICIFDDFILKFFCICKNLFLSLSRSILSLLVGVGYKADNTYFYKVFIGEEFSFAMRNEIGTHFRSVFFVTATQKNKVTLYNPAMRRIYNQ